MRIHFIAHALEQHDPIVLERDVKRARTAQCDQRSIGGGGAAEGAEYRPGALGRPVILLPPCLDSNVLNIANGVQQLRFAGESQADDRAQARRFFNMVSLRP